MRNLLKSARGPAIAGIAGLALVAVAGSDAKVAHADGGKARRTSASTSAPPQFATEHQSTLRLGMHEGFPLHRGIKLGRNKSVLVEFPFELRDVIVSNPELMDAVVQTANRVYLIGKKNGQSNVFFFDANGTQIATFEVEIEYDSAVLDSTLARLIPGSQIKTEVMNETVILTGSVRNPSDSTRASDIASRFIVRPGSDQDVKQKSKVINLLQIDAEEQVMLRVTVAEVERTILKQFGINIGAAVHSGNFSTAVLTENALPLTAALGLGKLPIPGFNLKKDDSQACGKAAST